MPVPVPFKRREWVETGKQEDLTSNIGVIFVLVSTTHFKPNGRHF